LYDLFNWAFPFCRTDFIQKLDFFPRSSQHFL
jgi:hypothetical protein